MRARRALIALLLLALAGLTASASPALANDAPGGSGGAYVDDAGDPTAVAHDEVELAGSGGAGGRDDCEWNLVIEDDFQYAIYDPDGTRLYSETGRWLERVCGGASVGVGGMFIIPEGGAVDPRALATDALASVPIATPPMATSPSADDRLYTQVRTWMWLSESWWQRYTATADAGRVTASVAAMPVRAEWDAGDGGGTTCRGPGIEWRRGMPDDATYCSYVYRHSSAGEEGDAYTLSVAVWFEVAWTSNTGDAGTLAAISRSASRQVQVGEVQAIETG